MYVERFDIDTVKCLLGTMFDFISWSHMHNAAAQQQDALTRDKSSMSESKQAICILLIRPHHSPCNCIEL